MRPRLATSVLAASLAWPGTEVSADTPDAATADPCPDEEFCPPSDECWDDDVGEDTCYDPPPICEPPEDPVFEFSDDMDGDDDGQLVALGDRDPTTSCGTLTVSTTGYYSIFDAELSESCDTQRDETGYLTITNSCNTDGFPEEENVNGRLVIVDSDNSPPCAGNEDCGQDEVCRDDSACCIPAEPTFMGTFLLVADEPNVICLHHWCPEYLAALNDEDTDLGFVLEDCTSSVNSIHFRVEEALACEDQVNLRQCNWGCYGGQCPADPCDGADCPAFCKDGECLDENPCDGLDCEFGCKNGYCLQEPGAGDGDGDSDGFGSLGDCDDQDPDVHPGAEEGCQNGVDDDCDGRVDEASCSDGGAGGDGAPAGGCGCGTESGGTTGLLALALAALVALRRRGPLARGD